MATKYWDEIARDPADDPEHPENEIWLDVPLLHSEKRPASDVKMGFGLRICLNGRERHRCNWKRFGSIMSPACSDSRKLRVLVFR